MKALQNIGQPLLIAGQPPKAAHPADLPFDHPAAWQQHEAARDVRQFDDLQRDAGGRGRLPRGLAGVPLVDVGQGDRFAGRRLDRRRQLGDLRPVLGVGGRDVQREQLAQRVDGEVDLTARAARGAIPARADRRFRAYFGGCDCRG